MIKKVILGSLALSILSATCALAQENMAASLTPVGGVYGMFTRSLRPASGDVGEAIPMKLQISGIPAGAKEVHAELTVIDISGKPLAWKRTLSVPPQPSQASRDCDIQYDGPAGCNDIAVRVIADGQECIAATRIGVVPPWIPGIRPESFFTSNTSGMRGGDELKLLQMIGMKVQRAHFQPLAKVSGPQWINQPPSGALTLEFAEQDKLMTDAKASDTWVMPLAGYSLAGAGEFARTPMAVKCNMFGPPRDAEEFSATWETILRRYPDVTLYEFWNEPWIFGWTFAGTGEEYRVLQTSWAKMARRVNPKAKVLVGNSSMFTRDHIEPYPDCWKGLVDGTTHHPYCRGTGQSSYRGGDAFRTIDDGALVNRRMGLPYYCITEGGTAFEVPGRRYDNPENAMKVVHWFVQSALVGAYTGDAQWDIGYGPAWTGANTTLGVLSHFTEDRPIVADIWPAHELIWGGIFANSKHVTDAVRALPRAAELNSRWNVPVPESRQNDPTKVAVIWSYTGASNKQLDDQGELTIANADGLRAFDWMGCPIAVTGKELRLPFNARPVYILTDDLSVVELRNRIATAAISKVTAVNLYPLSLTLTGDQSQKLQVRLENQVNREITGTLALTVDGSKHSTQTRFTIPAGQLAEVAIPWVPVHASENNQYAATLTAEVEGFGRATVRQIVSHAAFAKRTIVMNGNLDPWKGIQPVLLDSRALEPGIDLTQYLLNPQLKRDSSTSNDKRIVARVYTAYDDANVYLAASIDEPELKNSAGENAVRNGGKAILPYKQGEPDGLDHVTTLGDAVQFVFGMRDRVPTSGRQINDPMAWKGYFSDTDYSYVAHVSTTGDKLIRLWGDDTSRRDAYQCDKVPGVGPVAGAKVRITRDAKAGTTLYELAIPRTELRLFDPSAGRLRFGFLIHNNEGIGENSTLNWADAAGVFDHWYNPGSFTPTWMYRRANQTFFGIAIGEK